MAHVIEMVFLLLPRFGPTHFSILIYGILLVLKQSVGLAVTVFSVATSGFKLWKQPFCLGIRLHAYNPPQASQWRESRALGCHFIFIFIFVSVEHTCI